MSTKTSAERTISMILPGIFSLIGIVVLITLGTWQMQRLAWKQDLMTKIQARTQMSAIPLPPQSQWGKLDLGVLEYRPVRLKGRFLHEHEMPVFTHVSKPKGKFGGAGYWIITPFATNGGIVLVNRGFVPGFMKNPDARLKGQTKELVEVTGLLKANERMGFFTPENKPQTNEWYYRNAQEMAQHISQKNTAPFFVDMIAPKPTGGVPQPDETKFTFSNKHLGYAVTWYALALCLAGVFGAFFLKYRQPR